MCKRRLSGWAFALLAAWAAAPADPFAPAAAADQLDAPVPAPPPPAAPPPNYRVAGTAISGRRAVAVIQLPEGRFFIVRPGERIGDAAVVEITLDAVHLETGAAVLRLPVSD